MLESFSAFGYGVLRALWLLDLRLRAIGLGMVWVYIFGIRCATSGRGRSNTHSSTTRSYQYMKDPDISTENEQLLIAMLAMIFEIKQRRWRRSS